MINPIIVYFRSSLAIQGHQGSSLSQIIITSKHVWRHLVRTESLLWAYTESMFAVPRAFWHCAPCTWADSLVPEKGSCLCMGSAAISGLWLGFPFLQALFQIKQCHGRSHMLRDLLPMLCRGFLANYKGWQQCCLLSKARLLFILLLPKIVGAQRATEVISTWKSDCFLLPSSSVPGIYILDELHLDALETTVITTIIIEEEQEDLFHCWYNILLILCPQPVTALTLAFALCTQMPQKHLLEEEDALAPHLIPCLYWSASFTTELALDFSAKRSFRAVAKRSEEGVRKESGTEQKGLSSQRQSISRGSVQHWVDS